MKRLLGMCVALLCLCSAVFPHPGSGIVVDRQGNVYFIDTGAGVWKIDRQGKLTHVPGPNYHWLAIDIDKRLANVQLPHFSASDATVTRAGDDGSLLAASDFAITVGYDGALYIPQQTGDHRVQIMRLAPSGETTVFKKLPAVTDGVRLRWVNGLAAAKDGSLYYAEDRAVRKINPRGDITTVIDKVQPDGCQSIPGNDAEVGPYLRGLAVDSSGNVFVAAAGCGSVLKITPDRKVTTVLRATSPWSPTAVSVSGDALYVEE